MAKVSFKTTPVVCLEIDVEKIGTRLVRKDGEFIQRFTIFMETENIHTTICGGHIGVTSYCGFFTPEDAVKIEAWFLKQGAEPQ